MPPAFVSVGRLPTQLGRTAARDEEAAVAAAPAPPPPEACADDDYSAAALRLRLMDPGIEEDYGTLPRSPVVRH